MLPELLICVAMLAIAIAALLGAFLGQLMLNEHARNLTWAIHDANRVMERLRQANTSATCTTPSAIIDPDGTGPLAPYASANAWLQDTGGNGGGGKSIQPNPNTEELIVVTCQNSAGNDYCDTDATPQVGAGEWRGTIDAANNPDHDPMRVTVTVCWRHRNRVIGECQWNAGALTTSQAIETAVAVPNDVAGVVESPATLVTLMTCRR